MINPVELSNTKFCPPSTELNMFGDMESLEVPSKVLLPEKGSCLMAFHIKQEFSTKTI